MLLGLTKTYPLPLFDCRKRVKTLHKLRTYPVYSQSAMKLFICSLHFISWGFIFPNQDTAPWNFRCLVYSFIICQSEIINLVVLDFLIEPVESICHCILPWFGAVQRLLFYLIGYLQSNCLLGRKPPPAAISLSASSFSFFMHMRFGINSFRLFLKL